MSTIRSEPFIETDVWFVDAIPAKIGISAVCFHDVVTVQIRGLKSAAFADLTAEKVDELIRALGTARLGLPK